MQLEASPVEPATAQLSCYLTNLAALYAVDPRLAAKLDALPFARVPALEATRDGHLTVRLSADDGKPLYAHSRYRPIEEARTLVEAQAQRRVDSDQPADDLENPCFLVAGLGLGYHVTELERRFTTSLIDRSRR